MSRPRTVPKRLFRVQCTAMTSERHPTCANMTRLQARKPGTLATHVTRTSFSLSESTCASSVGGPGLNFGEHMAGRSRFGTVRWGERWVQKFEQVRNIDVPKKPSSGRSSSGSAISAFTPHTTVVDPSLTSADPSAVDIEPWTRRKVRSILRHIFASTFVRRVAHSPTMTEMSLHSPKSLPSGRTFSASHRSR